MTGRGWYTADKDEPICTTMERLGTLPFVTQPGEAYVYGYNTDILGCIAEKASGQPLDELIRTRITVRSAMKDTMFYLPPAQRERLVAVYASNAESGGKIFRAPDGPLGQGNYVDGPRKSFAGGAGLLSTAHDYARFLEMIRRGGELDGVRILSPRTVELMTTNQIGTLHSDTRPRLRTRLRDDGSLRRERHGLGRRVRLGRRLRLELPRRSEVAPGAGDDDQPDAARCQHRRASASRRSSTRRCSSKGG